MKFLVVPLGYCVGRIGHIFKNFILLFLADSDESDELIASPEINEQITTNKFYGKKSSTKRHFDDDDDYDSNNWETIPEQRNSWLVTKNTTALTWGTIEGSKKKKKRKRKRKKKRRCEEDHSSAAQGFSLLEKKNSFEKAAEVMKSGVDIPSISGRTPVVSVAPPRVQGSWKLSRSFSSESTPTDAEPIKSISGGKEVRDAFVLDDRQTYRRHKPINQQEDRPRAVMHSVANRFKSRNSFLTQEMIKDTPSKVSEGHMRDGPTKTRRASGGQEVGPIRDRVNLADIEGRPSRTRHASGPSNVGQTVQNLSMPSLSSAVRHDIESLPTYAQPAYVQSTCTPLSISITSEAQTTKHVVSPPLVNKGTSCGEAGLTTSGYVGHVGDRSKNTELQMDSSKQTPPDGNLPSISPPMFQFFTSDPQTLHTAASLSSLVSSDIIKNPISTAVVHQTQTLTSASKTTNEEQTSREPLQQIKWSVAPPVITPMSTHPVSLLWSQAAVKLPKSSGFSEDDLYCWVIGWNSQWLDICGPGSEQELLGCK